MNSNFMFNGSMRSIGHRPKYMKVRRMTEEAFAALSEEQNTEGEIQNAQHVHAFTRPALGGGGQGE